MHGDDMIDTKRVMVAALVGLVFILASNIPLPGIDLEAVSNQTTSGAMARVSIFAIWIMPLFTALALVEIFRLVTGRPRPGQAPGAIEMVAVGLIALAVTAFQTGGIVGALTAAGLVALDGDIFLWLTTATFLGMTALTVILCYQVHMPGFRNAFWLFWALPLIAGIPTQIGWQFDLIRTGAAPASNLLILMGGDAACVAVVIVTAALWRSACIPQGETTDRKFALPLDILIWPVFLATWIAPMAMNAFLFVLSEILSLLSDLFGWEFYSFWIFLNQVNPRYFAMGQMALSALFIPFLVFAYIRHNRLLIRPDAPMALIGSAIAVAQIALLVVPVLLVWNQPMTLSGTGMIAITLTMLGLFKTSTFVARKAVPAAA